MTAPFRTAAVAAALVLPFLAFRVLAQAPVPAQKPAPAPAKANPKAKVPAVPAKPEPAPATVLDPATWTVADIKTNIFRVTETDGKPAITAAAKSLLIFSTGKLDVDTRVRVQFRFADPSKKATSLSLALGLADPADTKDKGKSISIAAGESAVAWHVHDPDSKERQPQVSGQYRPQFVVERSLSWPESLRANVEADMVTSKPISQRRLVLDVVLREHGYEVSLDGIPLTTVNSATLDPRGFARLTLTPEVELTEVTIAKAPADNTWVYRPVPLDSVLNSSTIDGQKIDRASLSKSAQFEKDGIPFTLAEPDTTGNDHVDVGASWFRQGNLPGRASGRGADPVAGRWGGALMKDPARIVLRLPMARYRALHLIAAADSDADSVPVVTAQFYRASAGFPKNFAARVPQFTARSQVIDTVPVRIAEPIPVRTADGKERRLFHVTIPIDPGALAEFDDLDLIDVELTKQVELYRATPDPMYYSFHAAGQPSSVHVYALTAEREGLDIHLTANAYGHIWTAPEKPGYTVTLRNRRGPARDVVIDLSTWSTSTSSAAHGEIRNMDPRRETAHRQTVKLPPDKEVSVTIPVTPPCYGLHDVQLTVIDGQQTHIEKRNLAYLRENTRARGDWDFGRGPLFGFWNWGGGHVTPSAEKQLLVMAKAGIETTPGSFEDYTKRFGEPTRRVMEQNKIFTMKFAGSGDHYVTARFASDLKTIGLEKAREAFVKTLQERRSQPGPNSRPMFLSFYPEPSIGPRTHGIFPKFIGEPETPYSDYEKERYDSFLNGFVEGAKIVREVFPGVKCLLPHGDPAFAVHFLQRNPAEMANLLDGVTVDIPLFERLPEQQFHQVALHRLYMTRQEMNAAGITKPLLPMYEGPCIPSGPGALTDQEQADLTIRDSLILLAYGVDIQNGGFPAFDTASYWGEQHYGFGVLNRVSLETPKLAYTALATHTRHLNRANFDKWVPTGSLNTFALQFKNYKSGAFVHVLWTLRGKRPVTIDVPSGAKVTVFDQNDNEVALAKADGKVTFVIDQSPCYLEGLAADAKITLGAPDHSDAAPAADARRLANFGDNSWTVALQQEKEYEGSHTPYIFRFPGKMTGRSVDAPALQGGKALAVHFEKPEKERVFVPHYSVLKPAKPIVIPGKASHLGVWVKAAGDWGRVIYFLRDAKGEQWISVGTRGAWNCDDLHSWTSFNFDGWRYLRMEMPANSGYDQYREAGSVWWGPYSSGDGNVDLPLSLEKVVVERRTHVMYVNDPQPADRSDTLLGDFFAEYAEPADATPEAVRIAALRMPVPKDVKGLDNPIATLTAAGTEPPLKIERITLPEQEADGTRCYVHFPKIENAKQYDVWVAPYPDGRGALQLGKAWKEPGQLIRGLRPNQDFYLFATYTSAEGKPSKPSAPLKVNLEDFFAMK